MDLNEFNKAGNLLDAIPEKAGMAEQAYAAGDYLKARDILHDANVILSTHHHYDSRIMFLNGLVSRSLYEFRSAKTNLRMAIDADINSHACYKRIGAASTEWTVHYMERLHRAIFGEEAGFDRTRFETRPAGEIIAECCSWIDLEESGVREFLITPEPALAGRKSPKSGEDDEGGWLVGVTSTPRDRLRPKSGPALDY